MLSNDSEPSQLQHFPSGSDFVPSPSDFQDYMEYQKQYHMGVQGIRPPPFRVEKPQPNPFAYKKHQAVIDNDYRARSTIHQPPPPFMQEHIMIIPDVGKNTYRKEKVSVEP